MVKTIKNIRLKNYDYTTNGFYYVTICSNNKIDFSEKERNLIKKHIQEIEKISDGVKMDFYEVVSNHIHLILVINGCNMNLGEIIRRFKARSSKESERKLWQPNYFEHVIRTDKALEKIREYIRNNPLKERIDFDEIYKGHADEVVANSLAGQKIADKSATTKSATTENYADESATTKSATTKNYADESATTKGKIKQKTKGMTQMEILITIAVIGLVVTGILSAFTLIGRSVMTSKTRTITTNLAQEKVEALKNLTYHRLIPTSQDDLTTYTYDHTYHYSSADENITVGGISFKRYITIRKVTEAGGTITELDPTASDTGLKRIQVTIKWTEGGTEKTYTLYNLRDDPNRESLGGKVYGFITDTNSVRLDGATVSIENNASWQVTCSSNYYTISTTAPITCNVKATKPGYFDGLSGNISIPLNGSMSQNISLNKKNTGGVSGFAVVRSSHLVISEMCPGTGGANDEEYLELYNPTTFTISVSPDRYKLRYVDKNDNLTEVNYGCVGSSYVAVAPGGFFLALGTNNQTTYYIGTGIGADATFFALVNENQAGGVAICDSYNVWIDSVGWGDVGGGVGNEPPETCREGTGLDSVPFPGYPLTGMAAERKAFVTSTYSGGATPTNMLTGSGGGHVTKGNGCDSNKNEDDFTGGSINPSQVQNSQSTIETCIGGFPVNGGLISINDGMSSATTTDTTGWYSITNVATGTWTMYAYWVRNSTNPVVSVLTAGSIATINPILVSTPSASGMISGKIKKGGADLTGVSILVEGGGASGWSDSGTANYSLMLDTGTQTVNVNPDNNNASYTSDSTSTVIQEGVITTWNPELSFGGKIYGKTYASNGIDILPYIIVNATSSAGTGDGVSDGNGDYEISNLKAGSYWVDCVLASEESAETQLPGENSKTFAISGGDNKELNFKITSIWGTISGEVTKGTERITTGVLIMAVASPLTIDTGDPPVLNSTTRAANYYYGTVSASDGTYTLSVRKGYTYNVYGWYTELVGSSSITTTPDSNTANVPTTATTAVDCDLSW